MPSRLAVPRLDQLRHRHLQLLVCLMEERQLGKAAARLAMTQPAASKALAELEERAGCRLFVRGPHETLPTPEGELLIAYARHCLGEARRVAEELEALSTRDARMLRIGSLTSAAIHLAPRAIDALLREQPRLEISVEEGVLPQLLEKLRRSELDVIVGRFERRLTGDEFEQRLLFVESICIACRPGHPLLAKKTIELADTLAYPWILPRPHTLLRKRTDQMFYRYGLALPRQAIESSSLVTNLSLLHEVDRFGVFSTGAARMFAPRGLLAVAPIQAQMQADPFSIVMRRHEARSMAVERFAELVLSISRAEADR